MEINYIYNIVKVIKKSENRFGVKKGGTGKKKGLRLEPPVNKIF
jgi:hypothetical protein